MKKIILFVLSVFFLSFTDKGYGENIIYVGSGTEGLLTVDYSDISTPRILNTFKVNGEIQNITKDGNYIIVSAGLGGIYIFNINNPESPELTASYDTLGFAINAIKYKNYIFVADFEEGVKIFRLNGNELEKIGKIKTIGMVLKLIVDYPNLIIANENNGVLVYNISRIKSPRTVYELDTPGIAWDIIKGNNNQIIVSLKESGFAIYDFSTPKKPKLISKTKTTGIINKLYLENNNLFVIESSERINDNPEQYKGVEIFDISTPKKPKLKGSLDKYLIRDILIKNGYIFLALGKYGIKVLSTKDYKNYENTSNFNIGTTAKGVWCNNKSAVVADDTGGVKFVNISDIHNPQIVSEIKSKKAVQKLCGNGNTVYIADPNTGILIYDLSNPAHPVKKWTLKGKGAISVKCNKKYLYVLIENYGIKIYELSRNSSPILIARLMSGGEQIFDIAIGDGRLLSSQGWNGISMIDISKINRPYPAGNMKALAENTGIAAKGSNFFVTRINAGLMIGDDAEPFNLFEVSHVNIKAKCHTVSLKDNFAFVAADTMGMVITDIKDIKAPYQIGKMDTDGEVFDISVNKNNIACIADNWNGLVLSDVSNAANPKKIGDLLWFVPTALGD